MKDLLKDFKTGQMTDAEYVERLRKLLHQSKKFSWVLIVMGIVLMVSGAFMIAAIVKLEDVFENASQSSPYLAGLMSGISIGVVSLFSFYLGFYMILQWVLLPFSTRPRKLLVEYYDNLQTELAKPK